MIQGADLKTPVQISDGMLLANFQVLSGKGTYSNEPRLEEPSFIIDWSQGPTVEPSKALPRYDILFYADRPNGRLVYACRMRLMPSRAKGTCPARHERRELSAKRAYDYSPRRWKVVPLVEQVGRHCTATHPISQTRAIFNHC